MRQLFERTLANSELYYW